MKPAILEMTDAEYFASYSDFMTATQLKTFKKSPQLFDLERRGVIVKPETQTLRDGSAFHCGILEGRETFLERYTVSDGPVNLRTGKPFGSQSKAFQAWIESQDNPAEVISSETAEAVFEARERVFEHPFAKLVFREGRPEVAVRAELGKVACQGKVDWLGENYIADLKTCESIERFERHFFHYGYDLQAAFYCELVRANGLPCEKFFFVAVEKSPPFIVAVYLVSVATIEHARLEVYSLLEEYRECQKKDDWPTRTETLRSI